MIDTPALDGVSIMRRISLKQEVAFKEEVLSGQLVAQRMSDRAIKPRRHRLEVRVTPEQDALIRQAADLEDTTVTAFVLDTVTSRAKRLVKQHQDLVLSNQAFDRFIAELDKPANPVPELVDLFNKNVKRRAA